MTMAATSSRELAGPEVHTTLLSIGNGDTIRTAGQQRLTVRLACFEGPEMAQDPARKTPKAFQKRQPLWASVTMRHPG